MKTQVTPTSVSSYYCLENECGQCEKIARFLANETKAGRTHSIQTIASYFYKSGNEALSQTGRVSARLKKIKEEGVFLGGNPYRLDLREEKKNPVTGRTNEYYWLVRDVKEAVQIELF